MFIARPSVFRVYVVLTNIRQEYWLGVTFFTVLFAKTTGVLTRFNSSRYSLALFPNAAPYPVRAPNACFSSHAATKATEL